MSQPRSLTELADQFVVLNDYLRTAGDAEAALHQLVALAVDAVPACAWAAITAWPRNGHPYTLATSSEVAATADRLQYQLGDGPCLAAADTPVVRVTDLATDTRWPQFSAAAQRETPVRGVLSFNLADTPQRIALNLYSPTPGGFTDEAVAVGALFAAHARVLTSHAASTDRAANLETALVTSRQIGAAIGILMHTYKITDQQAFQLLRASSQQLHRKLRNIADDVIHTGALPDPPPGPGEHAHQ